MQADPHAEVLGGHVQSPLCRNDVGRDEQQPAGLVVLAAERVVLAEHAAAEVGEHHAGLHPGAAGEHAAHRPVRRGGQRALGEHREPFGGGGHPAAPVDHVARQQRQVRAEPGQLADVCLGGGGDLAQLLDGALGFFLRAPPVPGFMRVCAVDTAIPQSTGVRFPVDSVELRRRAHDIDAT